jgi:hypothetical protein
MKPFIILFALAVGAVAQDQTAPPPAKTTAKSAKKTTAKKSTEAPPSPFITIPKEATANPDGTFTYTDKAGKKWSYWNSPFGVMKSEVKPLPPSTDPGSPEANALAGVITTDKGDTVRFERQTPFGPMGYARKKSEMTDAERALFQTQHPESKKNQPE